MATISSDEVLDQTEALTREGAGICVGRPVEGMAVQVIGIEEGPIASWRDVAPLGQGEIGELCVSGPTTTPAYDGLEEKTKQAKIPDPDRGADAFWHRMGDVGYLDAQGRIWYCGRKAHRVITQGGERVLFSIQCEAIFNDLAGVRRAALVGLGNRPDERPVILIERADGAAPIDEAAILEVAQRHDLTRPIRDVLFHPDFPVDRRHNAKIHREELAQWAVSRLT